MSGPFNFAIFPPGFRRFFLVLTFLSKGAKISYSLKIAFKILFASGENKVNPPNLASSQKLSRPLFIRWPTYAGRQDFGSYF